MRWHDLVLPPINLYNAPVVLHKGDEMENDDNFVTITAREYEELQQAARFLSVLEAAGVDNWEGYDVASQTFWDGQRV